MQINIEKDQVILSTVEYNKIQDTSKTIKKDAMKSRDVLHQLGMILEANKPNAIEVALSKIEKMRN